MKIKKGIEFPAVLAVLLAIASFQGGAAIAKGIFPCFGCSRNFFVKNSFVCHYPGRF
jgi:threonine/homoserine efflux transporter RhtA